MNKVISSQQMIARLRDGMTIGIGGWGPRRKPMALVRELLRSPLRDLTVVAYGGADVGMLCAAGKVKKVVFAFVSLDFIPLEPYFRRARESGAVDVMEIDEGMLLLGLKAAAMRLPFLPTPAGLGTDVLKYNPAIKTIRSPYGDGRELVAMPALELDAALLHVDCADARGNCEARGPDHYMDDLFAQAARETFVSCEELVDASYFHDGHAIRAVLWPRSATAAVIHQPGGAHPTSCMPHYGFDVPHLEHYVATAKVEGGWAEYFATYIAAGERAYLEQFGGLAQVRNLPPPVY
jgi:glutaconate CoA-transferase subunit A